MTKVSFGGCNFKVSFGDFVVCGFRLEYLLVSFKLRFPLERLLLGDNQGLGPSEIC